NPEIETKRRERLGLPSIEEEDAMLAKQKAEQEAERSANERRLENSERQQLVDLGAALDVDLARPMIDLLGSAREGVLDRRVADGPGRAVAGGRCRAVEEEGATGLCLVDLLVKGVEMTEGVVHCRSIERVRRRGRRGLKIRLLRTGRRLLPTVVTWSQCPLRRSPVRGQPVQWTSADLFAAGVSPEAKKGDVVDRDRSLSAGPAGGEDRARGTAVAGMIVPAVVRVVTVVPA
ncbi:hypothetical protein FOZ62_015477, partial [Perkinsus olseni]